MERLKKVESVVEKILEAREETRNSNDILYLYTCEYFNNEAPYMTLNDFLKSRYLTSCPSFESVTRARRKVFEKRPELKPDKITKLRKDMETIYKDYALNA